MNHSFSSILAYPFFIKARTDVIFIHITKNAGTSIAQALQMNEVDEALGLKKHFTAQQIKNIVGENLWNHAVRFSVVRNPWDRMWSYYQYRKLKNKKEFQEQHFTFSNWLWYLNDHQLLADNKQVGRSQLDWLSTEDQICDVTHILRFEELPKAFEKLANLHQWKYNPLPHINRSELRDSYRNQYTEETRKLISQHYCKDIDYFKYTF